MRDLFYNDLRKRHPNSAICLNQTLSLIKEHDQAIDFVCRQLPALPGNVNIVIDYFGTVETVQSVGESVPTLTLAYRRSDKFLQFKPAEVDLQNVVRRNLRRTTSAGRFR